MRNKCRGEAIESDLFTMTGGGKPEQASPQCPDGIRPVGLLRSFCPSCMLIGVVMPSFDRPTLLIRQVVPRRPYAANGSRP